MKTTFVILGLLFVIAIGPSSCVFPTQSRTPELDAIRAIQIIHQAEEWYHTQFGRYAKTLEEIGPPAAGPASPTAADLIDNELSGGEKNGYKFTLTGVGGGYEITAVPVSFGKTGSRTYYSDQTKVIYQNFTAEPATAASSVMK